MEKLMDIYDSMQNPIDDDETLKKVVGVFSNCEEKHHKDKKKKRIFYSELQKINSKKYDRYHLMHDTEYENALYRALFGIWKENILRMTPEKFKLLYGHKGNFDDKDFKELQSFLQNTDDIPQTYSEIKKFMTENNKSSLLESALKKYTFLMESGNGLSQFNYISSAKLAETKSLAETKHRLYVNTSSLVIDQFIYRLVDKFLDQNIDFTLKYDPAPTRDDAIVIYLSDDTLLDSINILRDVKKDMDKFAKINPEWEDATKMREPPILSGKIDDWIGYGSEPTITIDGKQQSYTTLRGEIIIPTAISKATVEWFYKHKNDTIKYNGKEITISEYLSLNSTNAFIEKASKTYGITQDDLQEIESKDFKNSVFDYIYKPMDYIIQQIYEENQIDENIINYTTDSNIDVNFKQEDIEKQMLSMAHTITKIDNSFLESIRGNIRSLCKKYGIDEKKFCFDIDRVKDMKEYDKKYESPSKLSKNNDEQNVTIPNNDNISITDDNINQISKEQQEIEELLKKVINLTPENRKKAFQVVDFLEKGQEKKERE